MRILSWNFLVRSVPASTVDSHSCGLFHFRFNSNSRSHCNTRYNSSSRSHSRTGHSPVMRPRSWVHPPRFPASIPLLPGLRRPLPWLLVGLLVCGGESLAHASAGTAGASLPLPDAQEMARPRTGERLSDWLLRQAPDPYAFPAGLSWQVPGQQEAQLREKNALLEALAQTGRVPLSMRSAMATLLQALPVTGRVPVTIVDARWLQAHPRQDPVLQPDHVVLLPSRVNTVTFVHEDGTGCTLPHRAQALAMDYVQVCVPSEVPRIDRAWLIQPDGTVRDFGVAPWNVQAQDEPAPGALIWAPARDSGWPTALSTRLAHFLATQDLSTLQRGTDREDHGDSTVLRMPVPAARNPVYTSNDWGMLGLLQTPTARFESAGEVRFNYSRIYPYKRYNVFLQPFDWFEAGFRYTDIVNRLYGPAELSGNQTLKDKSIDFRLRLSEETAWWPQVALGMIDFGGTGLFSSEFLVASKRWGALDVSLGIGWGNLGSSGNIRNPWLWLGDGFATRGAGKSTGGSPNVDAFFRGPAALFGGLQYHTPWDPWILKVEYDGNDYQSEPQNNHQSQSTPINLGVVYRPHPALDLTLGVERGSDLMLGFTLHTSVARLHAPKLADPPTPRVLPTAPTQEPLWAATAIDASAMSGWGVQKITQSDSVLHLHLESASGAHWPDRVERIVAVMHRDAPATIDTFVLIFQEQGVVLSEQRILRADWVRQNTRPAEGPGQTPSILPTPPAPVEASTASTLWERPPGRFGYAIVPSWQQNIGGPDGFLLFRAGVLFPLRLKLAEDLSLSGAISLNLLDNFDNFKYTGPSNLPRVRTYMREYMTESRANLSHLQLTHFGQWGTNQYYSVYGGYLESMYAGIGGEWLYRPWQAPWAIGVDINRVQQRDFNQGFGFDDVGTQTGYQVTTGHVTGYWDTGWKSTHVRLSAGRYLAGDTGATLDISRTFSNGVSMGAWATGTNVSAEQFGEGSFDKGMYLRIPFDVMTTSRSGNAANLVYSPLTRDGGARLNRSFPLYGVTTARSATETHYFPATTETSR
jgi:hypothetical protein